MKKLPEGWVETSVEEYTINLDNQRNPISSKARENRKGEFPYFGATGQIDTIDDFTHNGEFILIGEDGANLLTRVKPLAFLVKGKIWVNNHAHVLSLNDEIQNKYFTYFFNSLDITKYVSGSAQPKLNQKNLGLIRIKLPPFQEQKRIVAKLDTLFASLENTKTRLEKIPVLLKNFKQAILIQAVTGKLTEQWREGKELDIVNELLELNIPIIPNNEGIPDSWQQAYIGDYLINADGGRVPVSQTLRRERQGDFPYYGATGVIDHIDGYTHEGEFILISEDGKNLIYRNKPIAFMADGKIWVNNHAHVLKSKGDFENKFAMYFFNAINLTEFITGIDQLKLSQKNLNSIEISIPSSIEQTEIVRRVESLFAKVDAIEAQYKSLKQKIDTLPQALLAKAFRGELVAQNLLDEPASVLLANIQALRQAQEPVKRKTVRKKQVNNDLSMAAEPKAEYK